MPPNLDLPHTICAEDKDNPGYPLTIEPEETAMIPDTQQILSLKTPLPECPDACYYWLITDGPGRLDPDNGKQVTFYSPSEVPNRKTETNITLKCSGQDIAELTIATVNISEAPAWKLFASYPYKFRYSTTPLEGGGQHDHYTMGVNIEYYNCYGKHVYSTPVSVYFSIWRPAEPPVPLPPHLHLPTRALHLAEKTAKAPFNIPVDVRAKYKIEHLCPKPIRP